VVRPRPLPSRTAFLRNWKTRNSAMHISPSSTTAAILPGGAGRAAALSTARESSTRRLPCRWAKSPTSARRGQTAAHKSNKCEAIGRASRPGRSDKVSGRDPQPKPEGDIAPLRWHGDAKSRAKADNASVISLAAWHVHGRLLIDRGATRQSRSAADSSDEVQGQQ
jgi:hypothetical protein